MKITSLTATIAAISTPSSWAFTASSTRNAPRQQRNTRVFAEGGPPQYDKIDAFLREAEVVGAGSVMLHIDVPGETIDYDPGHVIALEIESSVDDEDADQSKNAVDSANNGGWMRGPYTISRATDDSLDVLVKVVGEKSERFASADPGTPLKFGGKFKVPILEGIVNDDELKRIVLISTGVGSGPCVGSVEKALSDDGDNSLPPIRLITSYRTDAEVLYKDHLDSLQKEHSGRFSWEAIVTSDVGRISSSDTNIRDMLQCSGNVNDTHFHLIGNGQMVNEFKAGLAKAGVPDERVTVEMYFNHKAVSDEAVIERIAKIVSTAGAVVPATN